MIKHKEIDFFHKKYPTFWKCLSFVQIVFKTFLLKLCVKYDKNKNNHLVKTDKQDIAK